MACLDMPPHKFMHFSILLLSIVDKDLSDQTILSLIPPNNESILIGAS